MAIADDLPDLSERGEQGSMFDYLGGDLIFSIAPPGVPDGVFEIDGFKEPDARQIAEMLDNDGKARSLEAVLTLPVRRAAWSIKPKTSRGSANAEWAEEVLRNDSYNGGMRTSIDDVIAQKTGAFVFRRSYHEKVWKAVKSQWVYEDIAWRPPGTCTMLRNKETGRLEGFDQWVYDKVKKVPILFPYASVFIHGQNRDPVKGTSDLQVVWRNYVTKEKIKFLWFTYLECLSLPRVIIWANGDDGAKKAARAVAQLKNAGVAALPKEWAEKIDQFNVSGTAGNGQYLEAIRYLDSDSANSLLAGFTELSSAALTQGVGSRALSEDQSGFYLDMQNAYAKELAANMTADIVAPLVHYNYGPGAPVPCFEFEDLNSQDVSDTFDLLKTIATAQKVNLPDEFVHEIVIDTARQLGLDIAKIEQSIKEQTALLQAQATTEQANQLAPVTATTDVGASAINQELQNAGVGQPGQPGPGTNLQLG